MATTLQKLELYRIHQLANMYNTCREYEVTKILKPATGRPCVSALPSNSRQLEDTGHFFVDYAALSGSQLHFRSTRRVWTQAYSRQR